jgi:hypothetical protein
MTSERDLIQRLADELDHYKQLLMDDRRETHPLANEARAYLAQSESDGPAVSGDREPASVTTYPTDKELLELRPEAMKDEFAYAATVCSDATGGQVKPDIFHGALNSVALEYARAVLAQYTS